MSELAPGLSELAPDGVFPPDAAVTLTGALDPRSGWTATRCTIARAIEVVSNRSAFLLLREAFYGTTRFDDFAQRIGVSESVAAARLRSLVDAGLLERRPYRQPGERTRFDYHLTGKGAEFFPVLVALAQWGDKWCGPPGVGLRHHDCGASVRAELRCADGHGLTINDIDLVPTGRSE
jgi:DNA-binding HxlR family transcriptional regulator